MELLHAALLGIVEGLTEFLPVSSTGHLILFSDLLGLDVPDADVFEIVIQLGAILAIVVVYWRKFLEVLLHLRQPKAQHFVRNILLAFLPAMVIGAVAHKTIKEALFNPFVVALALILGGVAILVIERIKPPARIADTESMGPLTALKIGFVQCIAMIPGVSRSGATIMGALLCGVERKAAAEFSFFLAVPTMFAATAYDLYKNAAHLSVGSVQTIAVGFVVSFLVAIAVVRWLVRFISTHGFAPFAWYRIVLGLTILAMIGIFQ